MSKGDCAPCCLPRRSLKASAEHVAAFKALAHIDRLRVFIHLVKADSGLAAQDIHDALDLPAPTLSHHLDRLERAGLIERERRQRYIISSVRRELVLDLVRMLTACC